MRTTTWVPKLGRDRQRQSRDELWKFCPESATCPGTLLSTLADLTDCVDVAADAIGDELLCFQFRGNNGADWPCPAD